MHVPHSKHNCSCSTTGIQFPHCLLLRFEGSGFRGEMKRGRDETRRFRKPCEVQDDDVLENSAQEVLHEPDPDARLRRAEVGR